MAAVSVPPTDETRRQFDVLITDHPRIKEFDKKLTAANLMGQWHAERLLLAGQPEAVGVPYVWRWDVMRALLDEASEAMGELTMARRSLMTTNPAIPTRGTTLTHRVGFQLIKPGEVAQAHHHTAAAIRWVVDGSVDAFTIVNGEKLVMEDNDLILTPNWSWHNHENAGGKNVIWLDAVDTPLVKALNALFFEDYRSARQPVIAPEQSVAAHAGWIRPLYLQPQDAEFGPSIAYKWADARAALARLAPGPGDPHDGILLEYRNPLTNGPTLPTMSCRVQLLRPDERTLPHRHTSSHIYYVVAGHGMLTAGDETIEWGPRDLLAVPNWCWHSHQNRAADAPAYLFSLSDQPIYAALGLDRTEAGAA
jgi:gentisate 1,2-dioxygenase